MEEKVLIDKQTIGGRFKCKCGQNSGTIYHDKHTTSCEFCGRIYLGHFNKQTGIMESIEYKSQQFRDITPVNTFARQLQDKLGCDTVISRPQCQKRTWWS